MKQSTQKKFWLGRVIVVICPILAIICTYYLPEVWQSDSSMLLKNEMLFGTLGLWLMPCLSMYVISEAETIDGEDEDAVDRDNTIEPSA